MVGGMNPPVRLRVATFDDVETIAGIHTMARIAYYRGFVPDAELRDPTAHAQRRDVYRDRVRAPEFTVLCAERDERVVGFALYGPAVEPVGTARPEEVAQLRQIHVDPAHWRLGIGTALHDACVQAWQDSEIRVGRVDVWQHDRHARAFYDAHGWRPDGYGRASQVDTGHIRLSLAIPPAGPSRDQMQT